MKASFKTFRLDGRMPEGSIGTSVKGWLTGGLDIWMNYGQIELVSALLHKSFSVGFTV
jgi:hypothetical protein